MRSSKQRTSTPEEFVAKVEGFLREYQAAQRAFIKRAKEMARERGEPEHFEFMCERMVPMTREAEAHIALSVIAEGEGLLERGVKIPKATELLADWKRTVVADARHGERDKRLLFAQDTPAN